MPYRLKAGESVSESAKRIVEEEIDSATARLRHASGADRDEAIHEARKSLKKIRGLLHLLQPELGRVYRTENARLRSLGHRLSEVRDATAILEVFDGLVEKHKDGLQKDAFLSIRRGLEKSKRQTEHDAQLGKLIQSAISILRATAARARKWPLNKDGFQAIAPGLEDRYRRGRKAMAIARNDSTPEHYHEWRKRVKDHWYHVRLLESLWTGVMQAQEASLKDLETWLGDDHNLVVLCGKLQQDPSQFGEEPIVHLFLTLAAAYQNELREKALSLGERVYERKPRQLVGELSKLWDAWQQQPDSIKEVQKEERNAVKKQPSRAPSPKAKKTAAA